MIKALVVLGAVVLLGPKALAAAGIDDVPFVPFVDGCPGDAQIQEVSYVDQVAHHGVARVTQTAGGALKGVMAAPPTMESINSAVSGTLRTLGSELSKATVSFEAGFEGKPSPLPPVPPKPGPGTMQANFDPAACLPGSTDAPPATVPGIPPQALIAYQAAADTCPGLSWSLLAGIAEVESAHGQNQGPSSAGAVGWMQFLPTTWAEVAKKYDIDGDRNGTEDPASVADASLAAAHYLCDAQGDLTGASGVRAALWRYNRSTEYAEKVLGRVAYYSTFTAPSRSGDVIPAGSWGGYNNGEIPASALREPVTAPGHLLHPQAATAFDLMSTAFRESFGAPLVLGSSYRTYAGQVATKKSQGHMAAEPGTSNHGWGLAIDLESNINDFASPQHEWMKANGPKFGWFNPAWAQQGGTKPEPWHWEFTRTREKSV